jgi:hypothetical protein
MPIEKGFESEAATAAWKIVLIIEHVSNPMTTALPANTGETTNALQLTIENLDTEK